MKTHDNIPKLDLLQTGESLKIFKVTGSKGMKMPEHISTEEAVVIVQKGSALLNMEGKEYLLKTNDTFLIPAAKKHELSIIEDFQTKVVMGIDSEIQFTNK